MVVPVRTYTSKAHPRLALGREHDVPGVVLEGGVLKACPGLGLSQDEEGRAARCHVQGLCQEALTQVSAPDIEPQVPHGVDVLRCALNFGTARGRSFPALIPAPLEWARRGGLGFAPRYQPPPGPLAGLAQ